MTQKLEPKKAGREVPLTIFKEAYDYIHRNIGLSIRQRLVLNFILDRTMGWGTRSRVITMQQFSSGFISRGVCWSAPCGSPSTVHKVLLELLALGLVQRRQVMSSKGFIWEFTLQTEELRKSKIQADANLPAREGEEDHNPVSFEELEQSLASDPCWTGDPALGMENALPATN
jgi:hypothetical protein